MPYLQHGMYGARDRRAVLFRRTAGFPRGDFPEWLKSARKFLLSERTLASSRACLPCAKHIYAMWRKRGT